MPWLALGVSVLSLFFAGLAWRRAKRAENLQRALLDITKARAANMFDPDIAVINLTVKNIGKHSAILRGIGVEYWIGDRAEDEPTAISIRPFDHHFDANDEHLFQEKLQISGQDIALINAGQAALYVGVRIEYEDPIGPRSACWAFHHVVGAVDIFDKLSPLRPLPAFLQAPVYR